MSAPFQGGGEIDASSEIEEVARLVVLGRYLGNTLLGLQDRLHVVGDFLDALDDFTPLRHRQVTHSSQQSSNQGQYHHLRCKRLGGCHADLRPGMDVNTAVRFPGNGRTDHIDQAQRGGAAVFRLAHGGQGVSRLARLADGEQDRLVINNG